MEVTTATDEILRRWRNTCANLNREVFEEITREFMDDLNGMGYPKQWRMNALEAALNGYRKIPQEAIHRHGASTAMARRMKKLTGKQTWFKDKQADREAPKGRSS